MTTTTRPVPTALTAAIQPSGRLYLHSGPDWVSESPVEAGLRWMLHLLRQPDHRLPTLVTICATTDGCETPAHWADRLRAIIAAAVEAASHEGDQTDLQWSVTEDGGAVVIRWDGYATPGRWASLTLTTAPGGAPPCIEWDEGSRREEAGWSRFLDIVGSFGALLAHASTTWEPAGEEETPRAKLTRLLGGLTREQIVDVLARMGAEGAHIARAMVGPAAAPADVVYELVEAASRIHWLDQFADAVAAEPAPAYTMADDWE